MMVKRAIAPISFYLDRVLDQVRVLFVLACTIIPVSGMNANALPATEPETGTNIYVSTTFLKPSLEQFSIAFSELFIENLREKLKKIHLPESDQSDSLRFRLIEGSVRYDSDYLKKVILSERDRLLNKEEKEPEKENSENVNLSEDLPQGDLQSIERNLLVSQISIDELNHALDNHCRYFIRLRIDSENNTRTLRLNAYSLISGHELKKSNIDLRPGVYDNRNTIFEETEQLSHAIDKQMHQQEEVSSISVSADQQLVVATGEKINRYYGPRKSGIDGLIALSYGHQLPAGDIGSLLEKQNIPGVFFRLYGGTFSFITEKNLFLQANLHYLDATASTSADTGSFQFIEFSLAFGNEIPIYSRFSADVFLSAGAAYSRLKIRKDLNALDIVLGGGGGMLWHFISFATLGSRVRFHTTANSLSSYSGLSFEIYAGWRI